MRRLTPRERVEGHLFALGYIEPRIHSNMGYWSHAHQDVCRWEGSAYHIPSGRRVLLSSWDSMRDCARGIVEDNYGGGHIQWFAADPAKARKRKSSPS